MDTRPQNGCFKACTSSQSQRSEIVRERRHGQFRDATYEHPTPIGYPRKRLLGRDPLSEALLRRTVGTCLPPNGNQAFHLAMLVFTQRVVFQPPLRPHVNEKGVYEFVREFASCVAIACRVSAWTFPCTCSSSTQFLPNPWRHD